MVMYLVRQLQRPFNRLFNLPVELSLAPPILFLPRPRFLRRQIRVKVARASPPRPARAVRLRMRPQLGGFLVLLLLRGGIPRVDEVACSPAADLCGAVRVLRRGCGSF